MNKYILLVLVAVAASGCKKKASSASVASADTTTPSPASSTEPSKNTNYKAGAGLTGNIRNAPRRAVALNDMSQLGQLIEIQYNETGKMPTADAIKANLSQAQNLLSQINEGTIILTGTSDHAGVWAYEIDADTVGGVVLHAGSARRATKEEAKQLLGR